MAAPTIVRVDATPPITGPVAPGTPITFTIVAADLDSRQISVIFTVKDAAGGESAPATVTVDVVDGLDSTATGAPNLTKLGPLSWRLVA